MRCLIWVVYCLPVAAAPLVQNGRSAYSICLAADSTLAERNAASEIQRHVEEISGARLPVRERCSAPSIWLRADTSLSPEEFHLKTEGADLVFRGGRPRGVLYAAYAFLDRLGVRWYTSEVTRLPRRATIQIPVLDERHKPAFEYREPFFTEAFDKDWAARNRVNGNHSRLDPASGGKVSYYPFVHSFEQLVPPSKYFQEHPEYFSLIDGKRRAERSQLCLTNPDVLRIGVESVRRWIKEHPEATIFSVSQNDWEGYCECGNCQRVEREEGGQHSGPLLRFVNALAAVIGKDHPDKLIDTLAYWYTETPPAHVRPRPNVRIRLCPIGACEAHPYERCPRNAYFLKNLKEWSRITRQLYIWHYNTNFHHYVVPFPDFTELYDSIGMYQRQGVVGLFLQGAYAPGGGGEFAELRAWVTARLLWNPGEDAHKLAEEFIEAVYGPAAPYIRAYLELSRGEVSRGMHIWIFNVPRFSSEFSGKAQELLSKAEAAASGDAGALRRVRKAKLSTEYLGLLRDRNYRVQGTSYAPRDLEGWKERFRRWLDTARTYGIQSIHEGRNLDADEREIEAARAYPVVTLENKAYTAHVVPELNGRVIALRYRTSRQNLLRGVDSGERNYPNAGGIAAWAYPDYVGRAWETRWRVEAATSASEVRLGGTAENGLALRRKLALSGRGLETETILENNSARAVEAVLLVSADFDPGDIDQAAVTFTARDGSPVTRKLIREEEHPAGSETWPDTRLPGGEWFVGPGRSLFPIEQAERAVASWTAKGYPRATLGLWSKKRLLQPGEQLRIDAVYAARER